MGFKEVATLDADNTITLGGADKKSRRPNPTSIEGYFLGSRVVGPNKFNKHKVDKIHVFQTPDGNTGVWGKTNMDQKLAAVTPGTMIRVTYTGERDVGKGNPMQCFKVEVDEDNCIEVGDLEASLQTSTDESLGDTQDADLFEESDPEGEDTETVDAPRLGRAAPPRQAAKAPTAEQQAKVKALLGTRRSA